jgi:hypothetical protein
MNLRFLTLALLAFLATVTSQTDPVDTSEGIEERFEAEERPDIVECTLILLLDKKPHETAWEIRGPLPGVGIAAYAPYNYYESLEEEQIEDKLFLVMGQAYYFLLNDDGQDGIEDGYLRIVANFGAGEITLIEDSPDFTHAKAYMFTAPLPPLTTSTDEAAEAIS